MMDDFNFLLCFNASNNGTNFYEVNFNHLTETNANKFLYHKAWGQEKREFLKGGHNPKKSLPLNLITKVCKFVLDLGYV